MRKQIGVLLLSLIAAAAALPEAPARGDTHAGLSYHRETLPGGAVLLVKEHHQLPMVTVQVSLRAGSRYEAPEKAGLAGLTAALLTRGTSRHSASEIEKINDRLGGGVGVSAGRLHAGASMRLLTRDLEEGLSLLAEVLRRPAFPAAELEKTRRLVLGGIRRKMEQPGYQADIKFRARLYGRNHDGRKVSGSPETVRRIRREDVRAFHQARYGMEGAVFVFVGDITVARARELVLAHFRGWRAKGGPSPEIPPAPAPKGLAVEKVDLPLRQTTVFLGNRALSRKHPDFYAARVMNYILGGGGFESRILRNIREEKGLVYSAYSYFDAGPESGHWRLALQTKNESANQAIAESLAEIRRIQEKGVSDRELAEAKDFITGSFATRFDSSGRIAEYILDLEHLGFPADYAAKYPGLIRAVTKEQVQEAARKYIKTDEAVLAVAGNLAEAKLKY